jgi:hypothetical protein
MMTAYRRGRAAAQAVVMLTSTIGLLGCPLQNDQGWQPGSGGSGGASLTGGQGGEPSCDDDCPSAPAGWSPPGLYASGRYSEVPICPDIAPLQGIEVYADPQADAAICPVCQCAASETGCSVPTDWHVSAAPCAGANSAAATVFDAPPGWDGSCWAGGLPAGAPCGGVPCVQSMTVGAPAVTAGTCAPEAVGRPYVAPTAWGRRARQCLPVEPGTCPEKAPECSPPSGFALCVHRDGEASCPEPYPQREVFYRSVDDTRGCVACSCGAPAGNGCAVLASAFQDEACGALAGALLVTSETGDGCVDIPPGLALGGKTAEVVSNSPGTCAPAGGEPTGRAAPTLPVTVCCQEERPPR